MPQSSSAIRNFGSKLRSFSWRGEAESTRDLVSVLYPVQGTRSRTAIWTVKCLGRDGWCHRCSGGNACAGAWHREVSGVQC